MRIHDCMWARGASIEGVRWSAARPAYPEYIEARGPYGLVFPAIPAGYDLVFPCGHPPGQHTDACVRKDLANLARRAWRRPVTTAETDKLLQLAATAQGVELKWRPAWKRYWSRRPFSSAWKNRRTISRWHRSSLIFCGAACPTMNCSVWPSAAIVRSRGAGGADSPYAGRSKVQRTRGELRRTVAGIPQPRFLHRDPTRFPEFTDDLRDAMREETELFVERVIHEDRSVLDFLDAKYTFVNELLAKLYGLPGVTGDGFRQVDLQGRACRHSDAGQRAHRDVLCYAHLAGTARQMDS